MSMLSMNASPLHIDTAYCAQLEWGQPLVSSLVTLSIVAGMAPRSTSGQAVANLGWDEIRLTHRFSSATPLSRKRDHRQAAVGKPAGPGIVHCRTSGVKFTGEVVLTFHRSFLVPTRECSGARTAGYRTSPDPAPMSPENR